MPNKHEFRHAKNRNTLKDFPNLYKEASKVVRSNVDSLLFREAYVGREKYGCDLDRQDLGHVDWLNHALEETLDAANYLRAAILSLTPQPGENTHSNRTPNKPTSNATQLDLPTYISDELFRIGTLAENYDDFVRGFRLFALRCPGIAEVMLTQLLLLESDKVEKSGGKHQPKADVMLEMVGTVNSNDPNFLERAFGQIMPNVKFKDVTPKQK